MAAPATMRWWYKRFYGIDAPEVIQCARGLRYLHVMHNDKFSAAYIDLIQRRFPRSKHGFLFYGGYPETQFPIPKNDKVIALPGPYQFNILEFLLRRARKSLFHGFFIPEIISFLHGKPALARKAYWVSWGGDFYCDIGNTNT
jgi:dTDP-N-acetylfucosamine:lipid II N-acetylfucosaminyltransferase